MQKILVIQTAFIGDAILATGILEKLHKTYPDAAIDYMVRKGNEGLFIDHPFINKVIIWNKAEGKYRSLFKLLKQIRQSKYDVLVNVQRFAATGFLTAFSNAKIKIGFNKNPFSFLFTISVKHIIGNESTPMHEIERNQMLIADISTGKAEKPKLYPSLKNHSAVLQLKKEQYICIAPASVWFTKQLPVNKWIEFLDIIQSDLQVYLLGAGGDFKLCEKIIAGTKHKKITSLAGKLNFLESACLMQDAANNYVNDSAPMHIASSVNAITTAIYCSTLPSFGFGPLSTVYNIVEVKNELLKCRPCGLHGKKECPEGHFKCGNLIDINLFKKNISSESQYQKGF